MLAIRLKTDIGESLHRILTGAPVIACSALLQEAKWCGHCMQNYKVLLSNCVWVVVVAGLVSLEAASNQSDSKIMDEAWHAAEAYHFWLLAHRQLYGGKVCPGLPIFSQVSLPSILICEGIFHGPWYSGKGLEVLICRSVCYSP